MRTVKCLICKKIIGCFENGAMRFCGKCNGNCVTSDEQPSSGVCAGCEKLAAIDSKNLKRYKELEATFGFPYRNLVVKGSVR